MPTIWGKYKNLPPERIDQAKTQAKVEYLLGEYRLAFGACPGQPFAKDWMLWIGKKTEVPDGR